MANATYGPDVYKKDGGDELVVASGGLLTVESGGVIALESGGKITVPAGGKIERVAGAATCSSNAATIDAQIGVITSESLTTAAGSGQALTITCSQCAATDVIQVSRNGGTSANGTPVIKAVPGDGSFVVTIDNKHASAAFNGTFIIGFTIDKVAV